MAFPDRIERTVEVALRVVESGFAQSPEDAHRKTYDGHTEGWARELSELVAYLDAA